MIRVLLVDDHPIVREGLLSALGDEGDLQIVGAAGSAEEALSLAERLLPDVVLLDLELPGMGGIDAIPLLLGTLPAPKVVVFTAYATDDRVLGAIRAGARGYLLKGAPAHEIARAVRTVNQGGSHLEPAIAARLVAELRGPPGGAGAQLTAREHEVLRLLGQGMSNKRIARLLSISERTVKFHVSSLLRKLGASNRTQALSLAVQRGLV